MDETNVNGDSATPPLHIEQDLTKQASDESFNPPLFVAESLMAKFFALADERGSRYSTSWTYHLNRIMIIYNPKWAENPLYVPQSIGHEMLKYSFMPQDILEAKVAAVIAEHEREHMQDVLKRVQEIEAEAGVGEKKQDEEEAAAAEKQRQERELDLEIERVVDEYIEGIELADFDDDDEDFCFSEDEE